MKTCRFTDIQIMAILKQVDAGILTCFYPKIRRKQTYHHMSGVFSFKTSYADFFTASGHYYLVAKESFSHGTNYFTTDSDERVSISILYKEPDAY